MHHFFKWIQTSVSRRGFFLTMGFVLFHFVLKGIGWAKVEYRRVKVFLIRSIEGTQRVDLDTWRFKIEGLVEKPASLSFAEIEALPKKIQVKNFLCVEGWGLDNQKWEGFHLKDLFSTVKISQKVKYVTFYATGGKYWDSLSIAEALEPDTMLAYKVNDKNLPPESGFPLRLIIPRMYAYKGVKWVERIVFTEKQETGYWEKFGYPSDGSIPDLK
jgi:DMSO/TMAO reductase YedYZ molybdopterin-dependent catalytic subunit